MIEQQFPALRREYIEQQFKNLNEQQKQAVFFSDGALLILAGAGSGKTTVLVNRIANLIRFGRAHDSNQIPVGLKPEHVQELTAILQNGGTPSEELERMLAERPVYPYHILAITFTNKAAGELKNRLSAMLGQAGQDVHASTFHSACVRMLRRDADRLGYPKSFTIYDTDDQQRAMKDVYKTLSIDEKFLPLKASLSGIGRMKDKMISPRDALSDAKDVRSTSLARVYEAYQKKLFAAGAMDFDDLIYNTVRLLSEHQDIREFYENRYRYVLVDEYQDTSIAQFQLVYLLAGRHQNVCVVGDDDQSIYRFRGATIENILNFEQHFAGAKVIRLEQNYRSTSNILNAANCVIQNNRARKGKTLWTDNGEGEKIVCMEADNETDEAAQVVAEIGKHVKAGAKLKDHAVLYRMNAQSGPIENYFARAGIPYKIVGGRRFYDRKEVKDILAYMSIVSNCQDDLRLRRIINEPARKIGATTVQNVADIAAQNGVAMLDVMEHPEAYPAVGRSASALSSFYHLVYLKMVEAYETMPLDAFVNAMEEKAIVFAVGPAGTGKTFLAVTAAVSALKRGDVKRIVLTRPAVEAGESLGFLPGDLKEKVDPYLTPLYDALHDLLGSEQTEKLIEKGTIEIAPLAYMRGRTLNDAFVILDEAQNTTGPQMKMFLTRIGFHSHMVITGDITQIDLSPRVESGLVQASAVLEGMEEIAVLHFSSDDVVRHPLVQKIIERYSAYDEHGGRHGNNDH